MACVLHSGVAMRFFPSFLCATLIPLTFLLAARPADACSPPAPGLSGSTPADGATYPANGVLFFQGQSLSLDAVAVTVDGVAASLLPVSNPKLAGLGGLARLVSPAPMAGQAVTISGDFCMAGIGCPPVTIKYTASAADTTPPASPDNLVFNVYDYPDFKSSGGDCHVNSDLAYFVHISGDTTSVAPAVWFVEAFDDAAMQNVVFTHSMFAGGGVTFRKLLSELGGVDPAKVYSFRVTALDTAQNEAAATASAVLPCHVRVDPAGTSQFPPDEPMWTNADVYPGGMCDGSGSGSGSGGGGGGGGGSGGGGDVPGADGGCACTTAREAGGGFAGLVMAVGVALGVLRRRR